MRRFLTPQRRVSSQDTRARLPSAPGPRTAWSLFNGFTAVLRDTNMAALPQRTRSLHGVIDAQIGLSA